MLMRTLTFSSNGGECRNPTLRKCEVATHTPENGSLESSGTLKNSEDDYMGQNILHGGVLYRWKGLEV